MVDNGCLATPGRRRRPEDGSSIEHIDRETLDLIIADRHGDAGYADRGADQEILPCVLGREERDDRWVFDDDFDIRGRVGVAVGVARLQGEHEREAGRQSAKAERPHPAGMRANQSQGTLAGTATAVGQ